MQAPKMTRSQTSLSALAVAASAAIVGLAAPSSVQAAPYLHVSLVGRIQGSGQPFGSSVSVLPGDVVDYAVRVQVAPEGTVNPHAGTTPTAATTTITNWIPSNGGSSPTAGINSVRFNLGQNPTPGTIQADFDVSLTADDQWDNFAGFSPGTLTPRGNGNDNLNNIQLIRGAGDYDGIGPDEQPELLTVAGGVFDIASGGAPSAVFPNFDGMGINEILSFLRWRNAANTANINFPTRVRDQNNSLNPANPNPIIIYNGLTLLPEPAGLAAVALAAAALGRRRRRSAD